MTTHHVAACLPGVPTWKTEPPRLAEPLLARDRLLASIEHTLGKPRSTGDVFLVSAPAGYGKTTMLAQWAARASVPVAWYHLDAGDNDPVVLLTGLIHALRVTLPRSRWSVERMLAHVRGGALSPLDVRRAAEVFIADLAEQVRRPLALVLTGISELSPKSGAHLLLDRLLARSPDALRLALEAREAPRLRLSPLLAQRPGCGSRHCSPSAGSMASAPKTCGCAMMSSPRCSHCMMCPSPPLRAKRSRRSVMAG